MKTILEAVRPDFVVLPEDRVRLPQLSRILSLDIALGVLCAGSLAATICDARMPSAWWLLLPLSAWVVYVTDHLLDARRPEAVDHSARHRFFAQHGRQIAPVLAAAATGCGLFAFAGLPRDLLIPGLLLALAATVYLVTCQNSRTGLALKEPVGALLYVAGIWFGPILLGSAVDHGVVAIAALHFLAAWLNLTLFSLFEADADRHAGHVSTAIDLGRSRTVGILLGSTLAGAAIAGVLILRGPGRLQPALWVIGVLVLLPALLWRGRRTVSRGARYRWLGDGAFLLMAIPWLIERSGGAG